MTADSHDNTPTKRGAGFMLEGGIARILDFLTGRAPTPRLSDPTDPRAAVAAVLVEAAQCHGSFSAEERACIERLLAGHFGLSSAQTREMLAAAEKANAETHLLFGYITQMMKAADDPLRLALIEMLWDVAHADGHLHATEESLVEKIASLMSVSHHDCDAARARSSARLGQSLS